MTHSSIRGLFLVSCLVGLAGCPTPPADPAISVFTAAPGSIVSGGSTKLVFAVQPATATASIDQGVGDVTGKTEVTVSPTGNTTYTLTVTSGDKTTSATTQVAVTPKAAPRITVFTAAPSATTPGVPVRLVFAVEPSTATLAIDQSVGDVTGKTEVSVSPSANTTYTLTATANGKSVTATTAVTVTPTAAPRITVFTAAPSTTSNGVAARLVFAVEPPSSTLTIDQGVGDATGKTEVSVTPSATTTYTLTATSSGQTTTAMTTLTVVPVASATLRLDFTGSATAGQAASVTISARQADGMVNPDFRGTVHFTSDDPGATLPADTTFVAGDAGSKVVQVTFNQAGQRVLNAASTTGSPASTLVVIPVSPGPVASLSLTGPASTTAGSPISLVLKALDALGNTVPTYTGTVAITSTDTKALLPGPTTFAAADLGQKVLSVSPHATGTITFTATDTATATLTASVDVTVNPGAAHFVITLDPDAFASVSKSVTVTARDAFDNPLPAYAGTVAFTSTDTAAALPANLTLAGGTGTTTVTFNSAGAQTLTATATDDATMKGSATTTVHGLVYTDPAPTLGKVRLVINAAASTASSVTLDLVHSNLGIGPTYGGGAYGVGMNLPVDTTRIAADSPLIAEPTTGTPVFAASAARVLVGTLPATGPGQGVLMTALSLKAVAATGAATGDTTITAGRKYFTLKLKIAPTATVGTVFDGQALPAKFRATVRTRAGTDSASSADFALGKLEVR